MKDTNNIAVFFAELQRRRVLHIGGVYIASAWLGAEILTFLLEQAMAPAWAFRLVAIVFVVGFPVAMVLAWVVQVREDGRWAIDPSGGQRRTIMVAVMLGLLATAGLSWLILPGKQDASLTPVYQPIPNSVAILPLVESGSAPHERTVAATLYTALLEGMNQSRELTLMRLRLEEPPEDLLAFGQSVKVATLLAGRIVHDLVGTRAEMRLLDVSRNKVLWSQSFEWDPTTIMDTGTAIANGVLEAMELPILPQERFTGTNNPAAYDAFLMGVQQAATVNINKLITARENFQQAINLDPGYVLAYVELAESIRSYLQYKRPEKSERQMLVGQARQALETAQELDSESAAVISALGVMSGNHVLARQSYEHALTLDPNHALSYHRLGRSRERDGQLEEAERLTRRALDLDPRNADWRNDLAGILWLQKRDAEAMAEINKSIELDPGLVFNYYKMSLWQMFDYGRLDEGLIYARKAYSLDPENGSMASIVAGTYLDLGAREETFSWLDRIQELSPESWAVSMAAYQAHYSFGDEDTALVNAERALELSPEDPWSLRAVTNRDIEKGNLELALERWRRADPIMVDNDDWVANTDNMHGTLFFAQILMGVGEKERAQRLMQSCLEVVSNWKQDPSMRESSVWEIEPEIYASLNLKEETLAAMRRSIVDGHYRAVPVWYKLPVYDFIKDDPEFQQLMEILHTDLAEQLKRVREMECNGELAPAPGVTVEVPCN